MVEAGLSQDSEVTSDIDYKVRYTGTAITSRNGVWLTSILAIPLSADSAWADES